MLFALIFDFDGLILDTETPIFDSWQELYASYGLKLTFEAWSVSIGTQESPFNPYEDLETQLGKPVAWEQVEEARRKKEWERVLAQPLLPGVLTLVHEARKKGLRLGLASSSPHDWVDAHLKRLNLYQYFETIQCADDVELTKPDPALYRQALEALGVLPAQAVALEDSPNGVLAAHRAGIFCAAVPGAMTRTMRFEHADAVLESLEGVTVAELAALVEGKRLGKSQAQAGEDAQAGEGAEGTSQ